MFYVIHWLVLIIILPQMALSNQKESISPLEPRKPDLMDDLIEKNKEISNWFDRKVEQIDLFLVGKSTSNVINESSIKLISTTESQEGENLKSNIAISINPKLPNLEKFLKIRLSTYVERDEYLRSRRTLNEDTDEIFTKPSASEDFWHDIQTFKTSFEPRIELRDPLKVSYSLNFKSHGQYYSFSLDPGLEFFADDTKGVGQHLALNYSFKLSKIFDLRFLNEGEYQHRLHSFNVENGMTLNQVLDANSDLGYGFVISSKNKPNYQMSSYRIFTSWQRSIYRRVLDVQLVPHLEFQSTRNYTGVPGIVFNLIISF
jgi:hypothetical protein